MGHFISFLLLLKQMTRNFRVEHNANLLFHGPRGQTFEMGLQGEDQGVSMPAFLLEAVRENPFLDFSWL